MRAVWARCTWRRTPICPRRDALKVLSVEPSRDRDFRARFVRAADVASALEQSRLMRSSAQPLPPGRLSRPAPTTKRCETECDRSQNGFPKATGSAMAIAAHCVSPTAERTPGDAGVRKRSTNPWTRNTSECSTTTASIEIF